MSQVSKWKKKLSTMSFENDPKSLSELLILEIEYLQSVIKGLNDLDNYEPKEQMGPINLPITEEETCVADIGNNNPTLRTLLVKYQYADGDSGIMTLEDEFETRKLFEVCEDSRIFKGKYLEHTTFKFPGCTPGDGNDYIVLRAGRTMAGSANRFKYDLYQRLGGVGSYERVARNIEKDD